MNINKAVIFTTLGCIGVGVTTLLGIHATKKLNNVSEPTKKDKALAYLPTGIAGALTCGCIVASHVISAKELAAATTAVGVIGAKYKELSDELKDKHPDIYKEVNDNITEKHITEQIDMIEQKPNTQLYYLEFTDQLFSATESDILQAECELNETMFNTGEMTLYDYICSYPSECNLKVKDWMKFVGWYEGDTSYSYNSGYFGNYVKPSITNERINLEGEEIDVNVIRFSHSPECDPQLNENEMECVLTAIECGGDI